MAKRLRASTRSRERKLRVQQQKFESKYGYDTEGLDEFQKYRRLKQEPMPKFIRGNLSKYDISEWSSVEVDTLESTALLYHEGPKPIEALEHVILIIDRDALIDDVRD